MNRNLGTDYLVAMTVYIFLSNFESQLSHVFFFRPLSQQVIVLGRFQSQLFSLALRVGFDFLQFLSRLSERLRLLPVMVSERLRLLPVMLPRSARACSQ